MSADGKTILVGGEPWAYVFRRTGSGWTPTRLTNPDSATVESVALSDDGCVALVGAPGTDTDVGEDAGRAYAYRNTGSGWNAAPEVLSSPDPQANQRFGEAVVLDADGNTALVGAPGTETDGRLLGAVWAFAHDEDDDCEWSPTLLPNSTPGPYDVTYDGERFGEAVALNADGTVALVGVPGYTSEEWESNPMSAMEVGRASVFTRTDEGWDAEDPAPISFPVPLDDGVDQFGWEVALDAAGATAVIGARRLGQGYGSGEAYLFEHDGTGWNVDDPAVLPNPDPEVEELYSWALALDADGTTAPVGDPGVGLLYWSDGDPATGAAYVYTRNGGWNPDSPLTLPSPGPSYRYSFFGQAVALTADGPPSSAPG